VAVVVVLLMVAVAVAVLVVSEQMLSELLLVRIAQRKLHSKLTLIQITQ
jgi:hypothetical protein